MKFLTFPVSKPLRDRKRETYLPIDMTVTPTQYRYHLPQKTIKGDCPQCGPKHRRTLSRYVDGRTGEALPEEYGRCNRENNCGYHLSPYHKSPAGMSYADEVCHAESKNKPIAARMYQSRTKYQMVSVAQPTAVSTSQAVYVLPDEVFKRSLSHYDRNQFARLLRGQFGIDEADELLERFQIGTSAHWPGATVFWLLDEQHRARAGQVVLFSDDWHKARYTDYKGESKVCISSVSHVLLRRYKQHQQTPPDWLTNYYNNAPRWPILFGLHQLATTPADQPVAVVEAPKTAVVCSALIPGFVWLAVGSLSYLNDERLAPLRNRNVMLFPDLSKDGTAYARWRKVADELNAQGYRISISNVLEQRATDEQKRQGLDLADFLLTPQTPRPYTVFDERVNEDESLAVGPTADYSAVLDEPNTAKPTATAHQQHIFWQSWPVPPFVCNKILTHLTLQRIVNFS